MFRNLSGFLALVALMSVTFFSTPAFADRTPGRLGIGVGSTTIASGLSLKQNAGPTAFQLTAGCWGGCDGVAASLDFLVPMPAIADANIVTLAWNFGAGVAVGVGGGDLAAAGAFVVGLEVIFQPLPIDLVLEWRPALQVVSDIDLDLVSFGGHLRFYLF